MLFRIGGRRPLQHGNGLPLAPDVESSWPEQLCPLRLWGWWEQWVHLSVQSASSSIWTGPIDVCVSVSPQPPSMPPVVKDSCPQTSAWRPSVRRSQSTGRANEECFRGWLSSSCITATRRESRWMTTTSETCWEMVSSKSTGDLGHQNQVETGWGKFGCVQTAVMCSEVTGNTTTINCPHAAPQTRCF